jgi:hypothetical protein
LFNYRRQGVNYALRQPALGSCEMLARIASARSGKTEDFGGLDRTRKREDFVVNALRISQVRQPWFSYCSTNYSEENALGSFRPRTRAKN